MDPDAAHIATTLTADGPLVWRYKAEGGANVAFSYVGKHAAFAGCLLRVRKVHRSHAQINEEGVRAGAGLAELMPHNPLRYAWDVMRPIMGAHYVVPGILLPVPAFFLKELSREALRAGSRPLKRRSDELDVGCGEVVLMLDHAVVRPAAGAVTRSVPGDLCVELKPKSGLLRPGKVSRHGEVASSTAPAASPALESDQSDMDSRACVYCMHQVQRIEAALSLGSANSSLASNTSISATPAAASSVISKVSQYCPLELFSGDEQRVQWALCSLVHSPQNNFRLFADGTPVFTSETTPSASEGGGNCRHHVVDSSAEKSTMTLGHIDTSAEVSTPGANARATARSPRIVGGAANQWSILANVLAASFPLFRVLGGEWSRSKYSNFSFESVAPAVLCVILAAILQADPVLSVIGAAQAVDQVGVGPVFETYKRAAAAATLESTAARPTALEMKGALSASDTTAVADDDHTLMLTDLASKAALVESLLNALLSGTSSASSSAQHGAYSTTSDSRRASSPPTQHDAAATTSADICASEASTSADISTLGVGTLTHRDAAAVRDFMISTTAKDCSLLIALRGGVGDGDHEAYSPAFSSGGTGNAPAHSLDSIGPNDAEASSSCKAALDRLLYLEGHALPLTTTVSTETIVISSLAAAAERPIAAGTVREECSDAAEAAADAGLTPTAVLTSTVYSAPGMEVTSSEARTSTTAVRTPGKGVLRLHLGNVWSHALDIAQAEKELQQQPAAAADASAAVTGDQIHSAAAPLLLSRNPHTGYPSSQQQQQQQQPTDGDSIITRTSLPVDSSPTLTVWYDIAIVDVDPKPLARVPHYWDTDNRIRAAFERHGAAVHRACGKSCGLQQLQ